MEKPPTLADNPKVMHIDRRELYTSLPARMRYLHAFLDFNADDQAALELAAKPLTALIPAVVNIVYKKLLSFDITARAFQTRSTSYEGPLDEFPTLDSPQIKYRKMFLRGYLKRLCSDPTKIEYWQYLDKVGMMHVGRGRKHPLHIEFVHMSVLLGYVHDILIDAIMNHPKLDNAQKCAVIRAVTKLLWIQNDLFAKWYVKDGEEFADEAEAPEVEADGVLNGKRVVEPDEEMPSVCPFSGKESKSEEGEAPTGGCPFAGLKEAEALAGMKLGEEKK